MRNLALAVSLSVVAVLPGCGVIYHSPSVSEMTRGDTRVRIEEITPQSVLIANRSSYEPTALPAAFTQTAGLGGSRGLGGATLPEPVFDDMARQPLQLRVPPAADTGPYTIGVGDVLLLSTPQGGNTIEQLSGLLAAQNSRQGYTVQDDGAITIPNVGRVDLAGMTVQDAEAALFQRLVEAQIDPTFSLEISEFNSKRVSIGGAVGAPTVVPITLTPLYLEEALAGAGGITVTDQSYASVRLYRDGSLYQIPLNQLYSDRSLQRIRLQAGDSIFVDTAYNLDLASAYFQEQISRAQFRQGARTAALQQLQTEVGLRRNELAEMRSNFSSALELGAVKRDYVYLTGEVRTQGRFALPFSQTASMADALYSNEGFRTETGNPRQVYVLRGAEDPRAMGAVTAWHLNASNAANFVLATHFELRPNDVIFISEQPVTKWNRVINQITPSLIGTAVTNASD